MIGFANLVLGLVIGGIFGVLMASLSSGMSYEKGYRDGAARRNNCWACGGDLIWGGDFDFEDYGKDGDGIVSNLSCPTCNAYVEYYMGGDEPVKN